MSRESLLRLGNEGIAAFPPSGLTQLADWCWEYGEATADARYFLLWQILKFIADAFDDDGAAIASVVARWDSVLQQHIPSVVDAVDATEGVRLARLMRDELFNDLGPLRPDVN